MTEATTKQRNDGLFASITGQAGQIRQAIELGTMDNFDGYDNTYLNIQDGTVGIISSVPGESASTYADFSAGDFFNEITVEEAAGDDEDGDLYAEALLDIDTFNFYLETSEPNDNNPVTINFYGNEGSRLASSVEIIGSLKSRVYIPTSQQILEQMPLWLPTSFTDEGNYQPADKTLETKIETQVDEIEKIVNIKEAEQVRGIDEFPLVVQDGELVLHAVDENSRNEISGSLNSSVEGPDLGNTYQTGFKEAFDSLWGDVTLRASPGGSPLAVTKELDGGTVRNVLGHTGTIG